MKVALLQICATDKKEANLKQASGLAQQALSQGAQFVLLPEVFNFRPGPSARPLKEQYLQAAESIPGPSTHAFRALARSYKASVLLGSMLEKAKRGHVYNTSVFIDPHGQITSKYRKIHLFDASLGDNRIKEADIFLSGRRYMTAKAGEFRVGLSICYDLRFPGLYQNYSRRGVEILTVPSCFTKQTGQAHWEVLLRARAIENLCYVLAPNQVGENAQGIRAYGNSMVVSPWGEVLARGSAEAQEIIFADIDLEQVRSARSILPGILPLKRKRI